MRIKSRVTNLKKLASLVVALVFAISMSACRGVSTQQSNGGGNNAATQSAVKRVIVIVMQNSSFDHLFGTFSSPAGQTVEGLRPGVPGYTQPNRSGGSISPFLLTNTN